MVLVLPRPVIFHRDYDRAGEALRPDWQGGILACGDSRANIKDERLKRAIIFIESHYFDKIAFPQIVASAGVNQTTVNELFRSEMGTTPMEYLWSFRIRVAKKHLEFTEVPIKDVAARCGFATVQHFGRVFKEHTNQTPAQFRKNAVEKRKREL